MGIDETRALPAPQRDDERRVFAFEYGDRTISPLPNKHRTALNHGTQTSQPPVIEMASEAAREDTIARLETNLELALGGIQALLRRIDSIDETLAKLINR